MSDKAFWDAIRPLFGGKISELQFDGVRRIKNALKERGVPASQAAYVLATAFHETARWMQPIREGARRYGLDYTDAQSIRAVTAIYNKGIIRTNYALPDPETGHSYYGRGLVQITWKDNYEKVGNKFPGVDLVNEPDLMLEWEYALPALIEGMIEGIYRSSAKRPAKLARYIRPEYPSTPEGRAELRAHYVRARNIINGDVRKNGGIIADEALAFYDALLAEEAA